jgi:predicted metal-dependent hydrolase
MSRGSDVEQLRARGVALFNEARYFESHEAFEELWLAAQGADRPLYQGLVQACAGLLKLQRGQSQPALSLLARSLDNLSRATGHSWDALDLPGFIAQLTEIKRAIAEGIEPGPPQISVQPPQP